MAAAIVHQSEANLVGASKVTLKTLTEAWPHPGPAPAANVAGTRRAVNQAANA